MFSRLMGLMSNDIAIDLGTANTLIYVKGRGIVLNEPSVVAVDRLTHRVLAVGVEAKAMLGRTPTGIDAVRPMKDGVIADFEKTEELLRKLILKVQTHRFLVKPAQSSSACPPASPRWRSAPCATRWSTPERATSSSSPSRSRPRSEWGFPWTRPTGNMVIDIGGGTTEIAVITLNGIVNDTSIRVGGDKMDEAIMQYVKRAYNLLIGDQTAELIKLQIGSAHPARRTSR